VPMAPSKMTGLARMRSWIGSMCAFLIVSIAIYEE